MSIQNAATPDYTDPKHRFNSFSTRPYGNDCALSPNSFILRMPEESSGILRMKM